jgi:hypothetical protein
VSRSHSPWTLPGAPARGPQPCTDPGIARGIPAIGGNCTPPRVRPPPTAHPGPIPMQPATRATPTDRASRFDPHAPRHACDPHRARIPIRSRTPRRESLIPKGVLPARPGSGVRVGRGRRPPGDGIVSGTSRHPRRQAPGRKTHAAGDLAGARRSGRARRQRSVPAHRKPRLLLRFMGVLLLRDAERRFATSLLFHDPPRITRLPVKALAPVRTRTVVRGTRPPCTSPAEREGVNVMG